MRKELYQWQKKALNQWENNNYKGIISATTGSGKTLVAIRAIEKIFEIDKRAKVIIIVPTISLLNQWCVEIKKTMTLDVGRSGSKYSDELKSKKIMIYVANSALKFLDTHIKNDEPNHNLFLIADECHRYGSPNFAKIIQHHYKYTLGLSATPERESDYGFEEYLVPNLGEVIFKYNYSDAIKDEVISPFKVINFGIELKGKEREEYRRLSESIKDLRSIIEAKYPSILSKKDRYIAELRKLGYNDDNVKRFLDLSIERKRMLYSSESRMNCILELVKEYSNRKIMIFHEDVTELNRINERLRNEGFDTEIQHYKKKGDLERFRSNKIRIFLSAKMFAEGIDLPDVEVGIIAAASSSVRQKIQTMGRIIRKAKSKDMATIINLFIRDTTDERVFTKINWEELIGKDIMQTYTWPEKKQITLGTIEKKKFRTQEQEEQRIDKGTLTKGEEYTAKLEGQRYSFDSSWKLFSKRGGHREYATNQDDLRILAEMIKSVKPEAGSFFINNQGHVLVKDKNFKLIFVGIFDNNAIKF